ncbi:exodeoxyribonuclease VII small subunit [Ligilactobacillus salitolerans]|uniref:Exodeoxyribonuclease 7 small subunit n=1 Tax=Ligilactobacillus salitolerans TaxID=1808352 RepID=A0A401IU62_9LACO|nr:exodeoxyribonuclease VII small subunit [Ligilactobacillus salitolerans]GBG95071.1 exodeoxyribonuclease VII small subunit [Ligilactobacillus salitolerans]
MAEENKKEPTFEENLAQLEKIVSKLEQGDVPLEEALDSFQAGVKLSKELQKTLEKAEETLTKVINENGDEELFEQGNDENEQQ